MSSKADNQLKSEFEPVRVLNADATSAAVLVCEHASNKIPAQYANLGLDKKTRESHIAWDPGALAVARILSEQLDATLVAGGISRLIYDCNRPPDALDAMPATSEFFDVPGNDQLDGYEKAQRIAAVYQPFQDALARVVARRPELTVLVTIHSFTPVYLGKPRAVELGVLHDSDSRLADEMLRVAGTHTGLNVQRNQPYTPEDGVTHTLRTHGVRNGLLNVMLEIRNDLIGTNDQQHDIAATIACILTDATGALGRTIKQEAKA